MSKTIRAAPVYQIELPPAELKKGDTIHAGKVVYEIKGWGPSVGRSRRKRLRVKSYCRVCKEPFTQLISPKFFRPEEFCPEHRPAKRDPVQDPSST